MKSRFLLYKASAGSGKTYNLTVQYIVLLVLNGPNNYAHTLAVTFTNKATAEMKDRILEQLWGIGHSHPDSDKYLESVQTEIARIETGNSDARPNHSPLSDEEVRSKCREALEMILHDYSRFSISTIDAFFQTVLRNMAHELGLNARLQVDMNDKGVLELAVDNIIDSLKSNDKEVLDWLRNYIDERIREGKRWDVRNELKNLSQCLFKEVYLTRELNSNNKAFNTKNVNAFKTALKSKLNSLVAPIKQAAEEFQHIMSSGAISYEEHISYYKDVKKCIDLLAEGNMSANFGVRMQKMASDSSQLIKTAYRKDATISAIANDLSGILATIQKEIEVSSHLINGINIALRNLTPIGLLGVVDEEVKRINSENNQFMLAKTPILLKKMIGEDDSSFVFEKIGNTYQNVMIDEFQDTSTLQWNNFKTLLINSISGEGLVMLVGDVKQSIYRWRNGDWRILHEIGNERFSSILEERPLKRNNRSKRGIIDFNNAFFPTAAKVLDSIQSDAPVKLEDIYADVRQEVASWNQEGGKVRIQLMTNEKKAKQWPEIMLSDVCQQIQQLKAKGLSYNKMAILLRKRKFILPTLEYFAKHLPEVHLVSDEAFQLNTAISVNMIINALRVVSDPEGTITQKKEIDPIAKHYLMKHYLTDVLHQATVENDYCFVGAKDILPSKFIDNLSELKNTPLYELCESIYAILNLKEIPDEDAYLFTFFDELASYLRDNSADIISFLDFWENDLQYHDIPSGEIDGIRIFTIHKSKGLQFHTVLMPFAEWNIEKDMQGGELLWCCADEKPLNQMGTIPVTISSKMRESAFKTHYETEHLQRRVDELNSLYVAFTRAEHNLYIWGYGKPDTLKENNTIGDLLANILISDEILYTDKDKKSPLQICRDNNDGLITIAHEGPKEIKTEEKNSDKKEENRITPRFQEQKVTMNSFTARVQFRQSQQASKFIRQVGEEYNDTEKDTSDAIDKQQLSYIEKGKLLHLIFSEIETEADIMDVLDRFTENGLIETEGQRRQVISLVKRGLQQENVKDWFSGKYKLFNECNILTRENGEFKIRRPDRVMISKDRIIVVDFKFGKPDPEHKEQVSGYIDILQSMHPHHKIEGWLWYVYRGETIKV